MSVVNIGMKGTIPPEIFYIRSLADLQFSEGRLDGSIPEAIKKSTRIRTLDLRNQQLSGAIPAVFYDTLLRTVHLDFNQLTDNINGLEKMTNLVSFTASGNKLTGQIPDLTLSNLKSKWNSCPSITMIVIQCTWIPWLFHMTCMHFSNNLKMYFFEFWPF